MTVSPGPDTNSASESANARRSTSNACRRLPRAAGSPLLPHSKDDSRARGCGLPGCIAKYTSSRAGLRADSAIGQPAGSRIRRPPKVQALSRPINGSISPHSALTQS